MDYYHARKNETHKPQKANFFPLLLFDAKKKLKRLKSNKLAETHPARDVAGFVEHNFCIETVKILVHCVDSTQCHSQNRKKHLCIAKDRDVSIF